MPAASSQSTERTPLECRLTASGCVARFRGKVEWVFEDFFGIVEPDDDGALTESIAAKWSGPRVLCSSSAAEWKATRASSL